MTSRTRPSPSFADVARHTDRMRVVSPSNGDTAHPPDQPDRADRHFLVTPQWILRAGPHGGPGRLG